MTVLAHRHLPKLTRAGDAKERFLISLKREARVRLSANASDSLSSLGTSMLDILNKNKQTNKHNYILIHQNNELTSKQQQITEENI